MAGPVLHSVCSASSSYSVDGRIIEHSYLSLKSKQIMATLEAEKPGRCLITQDIPIARNIDIYGSLPVYPTQPLGR
jgi:hypothetical protein